MRTAGEVVILHRCAVGHEDDHDIAVLALVDVLLLDSHAKMVGVFQTDVVVGAVGLGNIYIQSVDDLAHIQIIDMHKCLSIGFLGAGVDGGNHLAGVAGIGEVELGVCDGVGHSLLVAGLHGEVQVVGELVEILGIVVASSVGVVEVHVKEGLVADRVVDNRTFKFVAVQIAEVGHGDTDVRAGSAKHLDHLRQGLLHGVQSGSLKTLLIDSGGVIQTVAHRAGKVHHDDQVHAVAGGNTGGGQLDIGNTVLGEITQGGDALLAHMDGAFLGIVGVVQNIVTTGDSQRKFTAQHNTLIGDGQVFVDACRPKCRQVYRCCQSAYPRTEESHGSHGHWRCCR